MKRFALIMIGFLLGATLLCSVSAFQKLIAGYNPLLFKGYIIPFLFGGISGSLTTFHFDKIKELNQTLLQRVDTLELYLPICASCKKIRIPNSNPYDKKSWEPVETYITQRTRSQFSHGVCPDCTEELYGDFYSLKN